MPTVRVAIFNDNTDYSAWTTWVPTGGLNIASNVATGTVYQNVGGVITVQLAEVFTAGATATTVELGTLPVAAAGGQVYNGTATCYVLENMAQLNDAALEIDPGVANDTIVITPQSPGVTNGVTYALIGSISYDSA